MIVEHAYGLHERVYRRGTDELPADSLEFSVLILRSVPLGRELTD